MEIIKIHSTISQTRKMNPRKRRWLAQEHLETKILKNYPLTSLHRQLILRLGLENRVLLKDKRAREEKDLKRRHSPRLFWKRPVLSPQKVMQNPSDTTTNVCLRNRKGCLLFVRIISII